MEQFKILTDLRDYIKDIESKKEKVLSRPMPEGASPVFYLKCDVSEGTELIQGIQIGDYLFSNCIK